MLREVDFAQHFQHLENKEERINRWGCIYSGDLGNLRISGGYSGMHITGSANKFLNGNNLGICTYADFKTINDTLSDYLNIDISQMKVTRLDWGANMTLSQSVNDYLPLLGDKPYFARKCENPGSIRYQTNEKAFALYDKRKEMENKKQPIPLEYAGANLLRAEFRLLKRVSRHLKRDMTAKELTSPEVYSQLVDMWRDEYFRIQKNTELKNNTMIESGATAKQLSECLMAELIAEKGGQKFIDQRIAEFKQQGIGNDALKRCKRNLKTVLNSYGESTTNDKINELDLAVKNAVNKSRNC